MDFSAVVNSINSIACILSVEKLPNGDIGELRIVAANDNYRNSLPPIYYDGMLYTELFPMDRKFEHFVATAALKHKQIHTYIEAKVINKWMDQLYIPLTSDREDIGYCIFLYELTDSMDPDRLGNVTMNTATSVIKSCAVFRTADNFKSAVSEVVNELLGKCDAERVFVVSVDELTQGLRYIGGTSRYDDETEREQEVENIPPDVVKTWAKTIEQSNCLIITDESDMKSLAGRNPGWADSLMENGIKSICFVPLMQNKITIGYLYVINFDTSRTIEIKELLEHTSFFLAAELANNTLMEQMKELSNRDMLTGVMNRNAMNLRVDNYVSDAELRNRPYGVVFIDLNGLKYVNDKHGHEAGDQMLWTAASIISSVFGADEIYRAGGDEFTVFCTKDSEDSFYEKIEHLRKKTSYPAEITMSIGSHYSGNGDDIRIAMRNADLEMYRDKEAFYAEHPELKARKI
ncbi:sensor domain-containing diguanylate cyclase [Butyrivibrio sp. AC2005]|uniref:sensor domain-containing diguanylate cyclase n=1 Tax=Butyrivibrio sp. AC2005 TaxID=1280672 RepID=UPI0004796547|nr:sensor domain-containing diguanylate cyclase [Butyrivibrio sp. AC2005]